MKRYINQLFKFGVFLIGVQAMTSCKENVFVADDFKSGIYFVQDSTDFSFGVTPLDITSSELLLPVQIMGVPSSMDRTFKVQILSGNTNASEHVHYEIADSFLIKADSVKALLPLTILRENLGDMSFKVTLSMIETNDFVPVSESMSKVVVTFNNRVEQPNWLQENWQTGQMVKTWPSYKLGNWNPLTYIKFMELFGEMEDVAPSVYEAMIKAYGGNQLPNFPGGWAWNYDFTLTKYVLIPLYRYFMVENPELGVTIPLPDGYTS